MENLFMDFINQYGVAILYAILTALAGLLARGVKKVYEKYVNDATKRKVAKTVVLAIEQIYKDLDGPEKFDMALKSMTEMLNEKGITITTLEARMLIEAAVGEFNDVFNESVLFIPESEENVSEEPEIADEGQN